MKVLNLKIKSPNNEIIRDIDFNESGISFVYGDIKIPDNKRATINSLGKTLLLKMIDYILGANEDKQIMKDEIKNYQLHSIVEYKSKRYEVVRVIGDSSAIYIDGVKYSLTEYKDYFDIERRLYDKQVFLNSKNSLISPRREPSKDDYVDFFRLLKLNELMTITSTIYDTQDRIKKLKANQRELVNVYGEIKVQQISEEIFFIDKEVNKLSAKLNAISKKIENIEISQLKKEVFEERSRKNQELKKIKHKIEEYRIELERLEEFIEDSNKVDISNKEIIAIYDKAKQRVPEMVKRQLKEVEEFHKKVYEERKEYLTDKSEELKKVISILENDFYELSIDVDKLSAIIAVNQAYQESIKLYEKYSNDLQDFKYRQGQLSQIKIIDEQIEKEDFELSNGFEKASSILKDSTKVIGIYRDFIYDIVTKIYDEDVKTYFDIQIKKKHQIARPIQLDLSLKGDTGEGVGEVKKNIIDYLIFRYNEYLDLLIQDSSCYNGIDPRQVSNMLLELADIAKSYNKQAIVAINWYQLSQDEDVIQYIEDNSSIVLSENDKLLKFDF